MYMKKFLALILVCLFCLPGAFAEADVDALIANGQYDEAIAALNAEKAQIEAQIAEVEALKAAELAGKTSVEVPITAENWDEYFEIAPYLEVDPFGNLEAFLWFMCIREEYASRVNLDSEMKIDIAYDRIDHFYFVDSFDAENHSFELGDKALSYDDINSGYTTINNSALKDQLKRYTSDSDWFSNNGQLGTMGRTEADGKTAYDVPEFTVTQAQGSLFIFEE